MTGSYNAHKNSKRSIFYIAVNMKMEECNFPIPFSWKKPLQIFLKIRIL